MNPFFDGLVVGLGSSALALFTIWLAVAYGFNLTDLLSVDERHQTRVPFS